ncbi:MAG: hypothetical protein IJC71_01950 [Clostridia bacterium]|nr:hypothetical protein [Clostridia bacterium]
MRLIPEQKNTRTVNALTACLLLFGGIVYALPVVCKAKGTAVPMPWLFSLLTLMSVAAALFILIRFRMTGFVYLITPRSDVPADPMMESAFAGTPDITRVRPELLDLVVMKYQGSRPPATECVLSLGDLAAVIPVTRQGTTTIRTVRDQYRQRSAADFVFYDYTLTFRWEEALELIFVDGQRYVGVILEADEAMRRYLTALKTNNG